MRRVLPFNIALASAFFAACVTINVYFPAAAAEKAADQIIDTVTSAGDSQGTAAPETPPPQSYAPRSDSVVLLAAGRVLELLVPAAQAQPSTNSNANIDISTPEIRAITASMQARFEQLEKHFAAGVVGLTKDGLVELRDANSVPLAERALVKRLVAEDNKDRNTLYAEIAKANGRPEWEADIRKIFARRWVERGAKPGWYYQDAAGAWKQK